MPVAALVVTAFVLAGCVHRAPSPDDAGAASAAEPHVEELARAIAALDGGVDAGEARAAAHTALVATNELAGAYRMTWPPLLHNALVNTGLRDRGLCCHWAEDLGARLRELGLRTLDVHWVVAHRGNRLREHNSPLVAPRGAGPERGLVLDGWRRAGELVWAPYAADAYPWELHPASGRWDALRCR